MKITTQFIATAALALSVGIPMANAQSFSKLAGLVGDKSSAGAGASASPADVARNTRNTLYSFARAETGLAAAMGGYADLAAQQTLLDNLKSGDAAAKKDDIETIVSIHKSASDAINKKAAENAQMDVANKVQASRSMVDYVKGLVAAKNLIASLQAVIKNPLAMGGDASTLVYSSQQLPGIVATGGSSTGALFKYLGANGVDLTDAKTAAKSLGS